MKRIISSALLFALLFTANLYAQQQRTITLQEAIDLALENNYQLKQAKNNLDLAEYNITNEKADFLPSLNANSSFRRGYGRDFNQTTGEVTNTANSSFSFGASSSLPIFTGFENINSLRVSEQQKLSSEENYQWTKETIIFNTASRFLRVLLDKELLEVARENLENSQQQLEQVRAQVEVGSRPTVDLYNQEATVANNEYSVTQQESQLSVNTMILVRMLQVDPLVDYEFVTPDIDDLTAGESQYVLSSLIDNALLNRSDLKAVEANIRVSELNEKIAKASIMPSLSLSGSWGTSWDERLKNAGISFEDQFFDQNRSKSVSLSLNIPIFGNLNRSYSIQSAQVSLKNAKLNLENSRLQAIQEVTQAHNDYKSLNKQFESSQKALQASERAFETQQERYNVGSSTLIELSQAQADYVQAQSNYIQAQFNLIFQEKVLDYYLGRLNEEDIEF